MGLSPKQMELYLNYRKKFEGIPETKNFSEIERIRKLQDKAIHNSDDATFNFYKYLNAYLQNSKNHTTGEIDRQLGAKITIASVLLIVFLLPAIGNGLLIGGVMAGAFIFAGAGAFALSKIFRTKSEKAELKVLKDYEKQIGRLKTKSLSNDKNLSLKDIDSNLKDCISKFKELKKIFESLLDMRVGAQNYTKFENLKSEIYIELKALRETLVSQIIPKTNLNKSREYYREYHSKDLDLKSDNSILENLNHWAEGKQAQNLESNNEEFSKTFEHLIEEDIKELEKVQQTPQLNGRGLSNSITPSSPNVKQDQPEHGSASPKPLSITQKQQIDGNGEILNPRPRVGRDNT